MDLRKTVLKNGMSLWYRSDDRYVGQRIALGKYEEFETEIILEQARGGGVAVDIGANIGYYTLLLAGVVKKVYALEPDGDCYKLLQKNIRANSLQNVVAMRVAASDKKDKRVMIKDKFNLGNTRLGRIKQDGVLCLGLDEILKNEHKIDLIKIDVQGWEPQVIEGAKKIIKRDEPVIFVEYTPSIKGQEMGLFLKSIYKNIWSIDYWLYIYRSGVHVNQKIGYVDLWMKKKAGGREWWDSWRMVKIKKIIKAIIGYE